MRRFLRELESRVAATATPEATPPSGKHAKRAPASPPPTKPLTPAELDQYMLDAGLLSRLPDTAADFDHPDDEPITIQGEPLSETVTSAPGQAPRRLGKRKVARCAVDP